MSRFNIVVSLLASSKICFDFIKLFPSLDYPLMSSLVYDNYDRDDGGSSKLSTFEISSIVCHFSDLTAL